MKKIIQARWLIAAAWIIATVIFMLTAPDMAELTREKGQISVPDGYSSSYAHKLIDQMSDSHSASSSVVIVFHEKGLMPDKKAQLKKAVDTLTDHKKTLHIKTVTSYFGEKNADIKNQLLSKDRQTMLVQLQLDTTKHDSIEIKDQIDKELKPYGISYGITGQSLIDEDVLKSSQDGLKKTEYITVAFILIVLVLVFRSVVAPFVPLLSVLISYLVSQSIVAFLVDQLNFPLSTFTQIFMVAIMFGIGTDYCILLLSRFKEELAHGADVKDAVVVTYKTAGKTVLYSGLAVLIGFACIGFATFKLYQSAAAVAVGVAVLLLALMTIVPFFMAVLGKTLFWPVRGEISHSQSKAWETAGRFSFKRPLISLAVVALFTVPPILLYKGALSYNSLDEIGDKYESVRAFNTISDAFGPGELLPATVVIKNDEKLNTEQHLIDIEKISRELEKTKGVKTVRSATRPTGNGLNQLFVTNQAKQLQEGLGQGNTGLKKITDGLDDAAQSLSDSQPQIEESGKSVNQLINGTLSLKSGLSDIGENLDKLQTGVNQNKAGVAKMRQQIEEQKQMLSEELGENSDLASQTQNALKMVKTILPFKNEASRQLSDLKKQLDHLPFAQLEASVPAVKDNPYYQEIKSAFAGVQSAVSDVNSEITAFSKQVDSQKDSLQKAEKQLILLSAAQKKVNGQINDMISGLTAIENGLQKVSDGQGTLAGQMPRLESAAGELAEGQKKMQTGLGDFSSRLNDLSSGLDESVKGLKKVSSGMMGANEYLGELHKASDKEMAGWFVPKHALESSDFQSVFQTYMSDDRKTTELTVVLDNNPYSNTAIQDIQAIKASVQRAIPNTDLKHAVFGVSGVSSMNADLKEVSDSDFKRTALFMLAGIFMILIFMLRSLTMPIYLVASLILTYFASIGVTEYIFTHFFGYPGVNWAVPFFGFVILMALGVDYSIFLMDRFNELRKEGVEGAMISSMKNMGSVIISAAIILAGTFAAMLPSGVLSLLQIATVVLTGLLMYAIVVLPFFVPVMVKIFGSANWWPFGAKK
ncbi:hypothetical protein AXI59_03930 [Bacillus nakamurai]|uniref:MMPL family transporter n=1 Tax=Bacillus nakamurai TaxID=1793963 RepID=UPI0007781E9B|nr:MMPL family transporter [Bacillus nakamurai]KXZ15011.1 hypothetical protein AXI59_03930 [Bacillus nakamurai]